VFYSDDGSTAVEAGMKMVLQSWVHRREPERRVFVALEGAYHGDTFGAMAAGDPDPFFAAFAPLLFEVRRVPADAEALADTLAALGGRAAGFLLEPLLQGAAGMRVMSEGFVRAARALCDEHGVPLIADEVMTGFGRTGALFACGKAGITPDVLCLAKGLTGGMLPLSATVATEELFACFLHHERSRFFPHGHTYTANPIACAVGIASLRLCRERDVPGMLDAIGRAIYDELTPLRGDERVEGMRHLGGMAALDLAVPAGDAGYLSSRTPELRRAAIERGVLLRPLGNVLYALPPACTTLDEARAIGRTMRALVEELG
jgi:adenosylmethionine-8-amino-7-oxononanoate aminotransferase